MQKFFATCPKGLENLLFNELSNLNASSVKETVAGVAFSATMEQAMQICLYSRFASRILLTLNTFKCDDDSDLYLGAQGIAYEKYFSPDKTIAVSFTGFNSSIRNTQYGALRVKDAICDRFVACKLLRPNVDKQNPDIHIFATLKKGEATISLDLSGKTLFFREYHRGTGIAPLKENLAAAMISQAGYDGTTNLVDPMCGSATILLEAALVATDTAAGLRRTNYGFMHLRDFDATKWQELLAKAKERSQQGISKALERGIKLIGFDADSMVVECAQENIQKAGFNDLISIEQRSLEELDNPCLNQNNLKTMVITNPPYGERMGNFNELIMLYTLLGHKLKKHFYNGRAAIISSSQDLLSCLRLSAKKVYRLYNGKLDCQFRVFDLEYDQDFVQNGEIAIAPDFTNRLRKNIKNIEKWAQKEDVSAYRLYDADIPEYNVAIDRYNQYYVIQEYQAPASVKPYIAKQRLLDIIAATILVTQAQGEFILVKSRERQKGDAQYEKSEELTQHFIEINEDGVSFKVNLFDYLDTGIFLDARPIRRKIESLAQGKDFLNLFAYTASASVMAALGGAKSTTSVDMSRTYLDWAMDNFKLNQIKVHYNQDELSSELVSELNAELDSELALAVSKAKQGVSTSKNKHSFIQADCLAYLSTAQGKQYDLIYIDPPTFSNSKRMEKSFDVQRDHKLMLGNLTRHLKDEGIVIFCTNKRGFKLDESIVDYGFTFKDITKETYDPDFKRDLNLHTCFELHYQRSAQKLEPEALVTNTARPRWSKEVESKTERFTYRSEKEQVNTFRKFNKTSDARSAQSLNKVQDNKARFKQKHLDEKTKAKQPLRKVKVWGASGVKDL